MGAVILDAAVQDDPLVVGVLQESAQARHLHRRDGLAACFWHGQAPAIQLVAEALESPLAARVGLKGEADKRRSLGIDLHGAPLAAVLVLTDVQVADRSLPWCAASL